MGLCDALIGQRRTSIQLYSTVHVGQCTVLVNWHECRQCSSGHITIRERARLLAQVSAIYYIGSLAVSCCHVTTGNKLLAQALALESLAFRQSTSSKRQIIHG